MKTASTFILRRSPAVAEGAFVSHGAPVLQPIEIYRDAPTVEVTWHYACSSRHAAQCQGVPYVVEWTFESGSRRNERRFDNGDFGFGPVLCQKFEPLVEHLRYIGLDHVDRERKERCEGVVVKTADNDIAKRLAVMAPHETQQSFEIDR